MALVEHFICPYVKKSETSIVLLLHRDHLGIHSTQFLDKLGMKKAPVQENTYSENSI